MPFDPTAPTVPPCPNCGATTQVHITVQTTRGFYCRCDRCGHMWHQTRADADTLCRERVDVAPLANLLQIFGVQLRRAAAA